MEMLNKLKSTVGGLIGNPVMREYEIIRHVGSGGPGCLWKIYHAVKRSTKQEAGVFVFEKKLLERFAKRDRDPLLEILRKGSTQLTRLRHPCVLTVQHPLEETRESLAFATEPVFASLANILGCHDNMPSPIPPYIGEHELFEVEIKYGLLQLTDALKFLHNDVHMVHGNITPASIILNSNGAWKLAGFDFVIPSSSPADQPASFPLRELMNDVSAVLQPNLNYLAPEYLLTQSCDTSSDLFSLGMLMYSVINTGKLFHDCNENLSTFKQKSEQLRSLSISLLSSLPDGLKEYVKMLLSTTPTIRPDADQLGKIPYFDDVGAMTLQYVDSLFQQDNQQKAQFFKGLPKVISKLPKRVVQQRVLPCLCKEFMNPDMVPFVLPNVLLIAEQCTDQEYVKLVLPSLKNVFKMQEPVQILLIFMQRMNLLLTKTPSEDIKNHVLPMVYRALESSSAQIQELCLNILPSFAGMIEYNSIKHSIVPRLKKICLETSRLSVRVGCLVSLGKMLEHMDKWFVLDEILPLLMQIPSREPAVLMGILGIIKVSMNHKKLGITKDIAATKVLPFLFPLSIDNNLNLHQFNAYMSVISGLIKLVEKEQRVKLEQLNALQEEQKTSVEFAQKLQASGGNEDVPLSSRGESNNTGGTGVDQMFETFGLDGHTSQNGKNLSGQKQSSSSSKGQASSTGSSTKAPEPAPVRPSQVSLSLEEKQRLQKEQEFQQRLKTQKVIQPVETNKQPSRSAVKDLSGSLAMESGSGIKGRIAGMDSVCTRTGGGGGGGLMSSGIGSMNGSPYHPPPSATSSGSILGAGGMGVLNASLLSQPVNNMSQMPPQMNKTQAKKNLDMSTFDSLLAPSQSQKSHRTLSQMSSANTAPATNPHTGQSSSQVFVQRPPGSMGQAAYGGAGQGSQGSMGQGSFGGAGQGSQGGMGQGSFGNIGQGQGAFGQAGMMGNYSGGSQGLGQMSWQASAMQKQQQTPGAQHTGVGMGTGFDPFSSTAASSQQKQKTVGGDNLLDFLG
ncbi:SCY1-like protein 2 isoform X3 [Strongylocentrotus purpuratus]|uniref:Protein kinase domain-containing protein n=1 Tax=Strongylocentrotus purpuratus TaxID=7668 RepID=A0A7M7P322_STRPU|nr:SCY1-like protein 2 isoform X1 [Strongylocentrotus purpuratus]XP_030845521.1 SCY1-like protein 2 isoform X2 [Strongylocentrotus purpuratus]XP_030845522.1 SCY1-like protein 2 isoform X3 [Strongylocentrotus purpuratus]